MINDVFIDSKELYKELKEIENEGINLALKLSLLTQKIKYIFSRIKSCENIKFAQDYFNLLNEIQGILSRLVFKQEIGIPDRLRQFVMDFDRIDDKEERKWFFDKIKNDRYSL